MIILNQYQIASRLANSKIKVEEIINAAYNYYTCTLGHIKIQRCLVSEVIKPNPKNTLKPFEEVHIGVFDCYNLNMN